MTSDANTPRVTFDSSTVQLDAVQRAAYAVAALMTVDIRASADEYLCTLHPRDPDADPSELMHRMRSEVIDQTLRLRIAQETEPLRNLIFSLAFAQTGLADAEHQSHDAAATPTATRPAPSGWQLLPLRFHRFGAGGILLTNLVGEHAFLSEEQFPPFSTGRAPTGHTRGASSEAPDPVPGERLPAELLAVKLRTRLRRLPDSTGLHMFVVTLRCEHTCRYCQVSRQSSAKSDYDMWEDTARRALDLAFRSPSPHLKLEFQGGEPLLNFSLIRWIVAEAKRINEAHGKKLAFVIATNLRCSTTASSSSAARKMCTCRHPSTAQPTFTTTTAAVPARTAGTGRSAAYEEFSRRSAPTG